MIEHTCFLSRSLTYWKWCPCSLIYLLFWLCRPSNEKDHLGTFKPRLFPSAYFYAFSGIGATLYEKSHHGLSLRSFPSFLSRKYCRTNLVSFMLVKLFEWSSSQYRFNLFRPDWTTNGKEFFLPQKDGRALPHTLLSLFRLGRLHTKKRPHWSLVPIFRLSKNENTIDHLLSRAH